MPLNRLTTFETAVLKCLKPILEPEVHYRIGEYRVDFACIKLVHAVFQALDGELAGWIRAVLLLEAAGWNIICLQAIAPDPKDEEGRLVLVMPENKWRQICDLPILPECRIIVEAMEEALEENA